MPDKKGSPFLLLRICFVGGLGLFLLLHAFIITKTDSKLFVSRTATDDYPDHLLDYKGFLVNTEGCRIPDLDPLDPAVRKFISDEKPLDCQKEYGPVLVESNLTSVFINVSALPYYNLSDTSELHCCYTPFWRVEEEERSSGQYPGDVDSKTKFAQNCTSFLDAADINDEFVKIECYLNDSTKYTDYHAFIPMKSAAKIQTNKTIDEEGVSVMVLGVDAVSRLNLHRQMPLTVKFLQKQLNAVEMLGYNKVEDNTFPNLVPVLTGLSVKELKDSCWPTTNSVFDDCNFIWKNFSAAGYKTAFAEDASWMGIFSYVKRGFRKQPTDYYMKVFNKVSEDKIGFAKWLNAKLCVGPRKTLETLLSYAYKFSITMKQTLSFGFFWGASLTHDYLNLPKQGDKDHKNLLESLHKQGIFNRTVLIFMSDHGIRWGGIRGTYQGYMEERLPFLFIAYPDWFRIKYTTAISNLKKNAQKLTTPFDLHEVLLDLTNVSSRLNKHAIKSRSEELENSKPIPRGISLFLPVPGSRKCSDADIVDHWCTCHQSSSIPTNNTFVRRGANYLVKHINSLLEDYVQCAKLQLNKILSARTEISVSHNSFITSDAGIKDYSLSVETVPGRGLFEATVRYNGNSDSFTLVGTISRINLYGDQSRCVPQYRLRLYCYCIHD